MNIEKTGVEYKIPGIVVVMVIIRETTGRSLSVNKAALCQTEDSQVRSSTMPD